MGKFKVGDKVKVERVDSSWKGYTGKCTEGRRKHSRKIRGKPPGLAECLAKAAGAVRRREDEQGVR